MMQLTKGTFLVLALCLSCGGGWAKPRLALIQEIWAGLGDATDGIIDEISKATREGTELTSDLLDLGLDLGIQVASAVSEALEDNLEKLADSLDNNIEELRNVTRDETDKVKQNALKNGLSSLELLAKNLEKLQKELDGMSDRYDDTIQDQLSQSLHELNTWAELELKRVDEATGGAGVPRAKRSIDGVVNRYEKDLNKTLNDFIIVQTLFESDVNDAVEDYEEYAGLLIEQMNNCAEQSSKRCRDNINLLSSKVRTSTSQLNELIRTGNQLAAAGLKASKNFENIEPNLTKDMEKVEKDNDRIIRLNPTTTTKATSAQPDSSTSGSSDSSSEASSDASTDASSSDSSNSSDSTDASSSDE